MRASPLLAGVLAAGAAGCLGEAPPEALPPLDAALLRARIQPILERDCARSSCHGDPGRPLRLYGRSSLRLPGRVPGTPIDDAELAANLAMMRGFLVGVADPGDSLVLRKPLAEAAGGAPHAGAEDPYPSRDHPAYRLLACWLAGGGPATCDDGT